MPDEAVEKAARETPVTSRDVHCSPCLFLSDARDSSQSDPLTALSHGFPAFAGLAGLSKTQRILHHPLPATLLTHLSLAFLRLPVRRGRPPQTRWDRGGRLGTLVHEASGRRVPAYASAKGFAPGPPPPSNGSRLSHVQPPNSHLLALARRPLLSFHPSTQPLCLLASEVSPADPSPASSHPGRPSPAAISLSDACWAGAGTREATKKTPADSCFALVPLLVITYSTWGHVNTLADGELTLPAWPAERRS